MVPGVRAFLPTSLANSPDLLEGLFAGSTPCVGEYCISASNDLGAGEIM